MPIHGHIYNGMPNSLQMWHEARLDCRCGRRQGLRVGARNDDNLKTAMTRCFLSRLHHVTTPKKQPSHWRRDGKMPVSAQNPVTTPKNRPPHRRRDKNPHRDSARVRITRHFSRKTRLCFGKSPKHSVRFAENRPLLREKPEAQRAFCRKPASASGKARSRGAAGSALADWIAVDVPEDVAEFVAVQLGLEFLALVLGVGAE